MLKILGALILGLILVLGCGAFCEKADNNTTIFRQAITVQSNSFEPALVTVPKNSLVTWTNKDTAEHQIASDGDLAELKSGILDQDNAYMFTFEKTGTWKYHCELHPEIKGTIIVK